MYWWAVFICIYDMYIIHALHTFTCLHIWTYEMHIQYAHTICTEEIEESLKRYTFTIVKRFIPYWKTAFNAAGEPPAPRSQDKYQYGIGAAAFSAGFLGPPDVKKVSVHIISPYHMFILYAHIICSFRL